jgi:hypothetical protein
MHVLCSRTEAILISIKLRHFVAALRLISLICTKQIIAASRFRRRREHFRPSTATHYVPWL